VVVGGRNSAFCVPLSATNPLSSLASETVWRITDQKGENDPDYTLAFRSVQKATRDKIIGDNGVTCKLVLYDQHQVL